jgi:hypothetical protein
MKEVRKERKTEREKGNEAKEMCQYKYKDAVFTVT